MIIEQQQILATQNLAVVIAELGLAAPLRDHLDEMANQCFTWVCRRLQVKADGWHAEKIAVKNAAYAWRQMVFYLALRPSGVQAEFLAWAKDHLDEQEAGFRARFRPALSGLAAAVHGQAPDPGSPESRPFLGWSYTGHWLLAE